MKKTKNVKEKNLPLVERANFIISDFSQKNNKACNSLALSDDKEYTGSISFENFTVNFIVGEDLSRGYRFMETPFARAMDDDFDFDMNLLTRIKFTFSPIEFSLYDIHNVIHSDQFITLDFHEIRSIEDVDSALTTVLNFINRNLLLINEIALRADLQANLLQNFFNDVKALDKKMTEEEFYSEFEDEAVCHELMLNSHIDLDEAIDKYICKNLFSDLVKKSSKLEKKGKLLTFEKRYVDYLDRNGYPQVEGLLTEKRKKSNKRYWGKIIVKLVVFAFSAVLALFIYFMADVSATEVFYADKVYLGSYDHTIAVWFIIFGVQQFVAWLINFMPTIREKFGYLGLISSTDNKTVNIISIIGVVALFIGIGFSFFHVKEHSLILDDSGVYLENEIISEDRIEFFYIEGYLNYDENGNENITYGSDFTEFYFVVDGDYEDYIWCSGLSDEEGNLNNDVVVALEKQGYKLQTYKCIEDYCEDHGFEYSAE